MINTSIALAVASGGVALSTAVTAVSNPSKYALEIAATFAGVFGGLIWQLWTSEQLKPTRRVMIADIMASAFSGFVVSVLGLPACLAFANKFMPEDAKIVLEPSRYLVGTLALAVLAGMYGAHFIRKRVLPNDGKP